MTPRHRSDSRYDEPQAHALASAVVFRNCSLRAGVSPPTRRACRTLMRAQAIRWRHERKEGKGVHAGD